jgi:hypothetical protein
MRYLRFLLLYQSTQIRILCLKIRRISSVHEILIYYVTLWNDREKQVGQRLFLESATMLTRIAIKGEATGGSSNTVTNRSPLTHLADIITTAV